jgi:hypothetical protein
MASALHSPGGMTSDPSVRHSDTNGGRLGCLPLVLGIGLVLLLVIILAVALFWRSIWWKESGAPVPRGTERVLPESPQTLITVDWSREHRTGGPADVGRPVSPAVALASRARVDGVRSSAVRSHTPAATGC